VAIVVKCGMERTSGGGVVRCGAVWCGCCALTCVV